jgi:hypothetical protein
MESRKLKILLILTVFLFFIPFLVSAGILPCGPFTQKPNCEPCDLLVLFVNVIEFLLFRLIPILAAVVLGYGAFTFLIGLLQQSSEAVNKGKRWLLSVFVGLVIIYGGWLLVDLFLRLMGFTQEKWSGLKGAWWRIDIQCEVQRKPKIPKEYTLFEPLEPIKIPTSSGPTGSKGIEDEGEEKCVKIAGKNDSRRIVLIPLNYNEICNKNWSEEDLKKEWIEFTNKFSNALSEESDPFTEDNFSIYRYDKIANSGISPCSSFKKVYVMKCNFIGAGRGYAGFGGNVVLALSASSEDLIHELGHAVGSLYDEYVLDTIINDEKFIEEIRRRAEEMYRINGEKNCVKDKCPDWWKDYGAECIEGCNLVSKGFFRDSSCSVMNLYRNFDEKLGQPCSRSFGPISKYYLYKALGLDTEKLKIKK